MTGDMQRRTVDAEIVGFAHQELQRAADLRHDVGDGRRRAEFMIDVGDGISGV